MTLALWTLDLSTNNALQAKRRSVARRLRALEGSYEVHERWLKELYGTPEKLKSALLVEERQEI